MVPEEPRRHTKAARALREGRPVAARFVRGGRPGGRVLAVLVVSTLAVAFVLLALWAGSNGAFLRQNPSEAQQAADAQAFDENEGQPAPSTSATASAISG